MSLYEALRVAEDQDLDLVEVGPGARPPVARVLDYGKYIYEQERKQSQQKKTSTDVKEIRLSVNIDDHDWKVRVERAKKFLDQSGKVKLDMKLAGREMLFQERAIDRLNDFRRQLGAEYEQYPQKLGRRYIAVLKKGKEGNNEKQAENIKDSSKKSEKSNTQG